MQLARKRRMRGRSLTVLGFQLPRQHAHAACRKLQCNIDPAESSIRKHRRSWALDAGPASRGSDCGLCSGGSGGPAIAPRARAPDIPQLENLQPFSDHASHRYRQLLVPSEAAPDRPARHSSAVERCRPPHHRAPCSEPPGYSPLPVARSGPNPRRARASPQPAFLNPTRPARHSILPPHTQQHSNSTTEMVIEIPPHLSKPVGTVRLGSLLGRFGWGAWVRRSTPRDGEGGGGRAGGRLEIAGVDVDGMSSAVEWRC